MYDPSIWRDYFVMVGGGAAALTGLVFVAVILYRSTRDAFQAADTRVLLRALGSFGCLVTEQAGAAILFFGAAWGLYVVGLGMMASFVFMVSGAWLLLVGVESSQAGRK